MQPNWAEENLQVIRTLMERAGLYRRALAPVMLAVGSIGLCAGLLAAVFRFAWVVGFAAYWLVVAIIAASVAILLVRRQAFRAGEDVWTPPARRVIQALLPPFTVATALTVSLSLRLVVSIDETRLVACWLVLYGCGLCAAGAYVSRGVRILGWLFILGGPVTVALNALNSAWGLFQVIPTGGFKGSPLDPGQFVDVNLVMAATFGGLHLLAAAYLYFTEKRQPTP